MKFAFAFAFSFVWLTLSMMGCGFVSTDDAIMACNNVSTKLDDRGRCTVDFLGCPNDGRVYMICAQDGANYSCICNSSYSDEMTSGPLSVDVCELDVDMVRHEASKICD